MGWPDNKVARVFSVICTSRPELQPQSSDIPLSSFSTGNSAGQNWIHRVSLPNLFLPLNLISVTAIVFFSVPLVKAFCDPSLSSSPIFKTLDICLVLKNRSGDIRPSLLRGDNWPLRGCPLMQRVCSWSCLFPSLPSPLFPPPWGSQSQKSGQSQLVFVGKVEGSMLDIKC